MKYFYGNLFSMQTLFINIKNYYKPLETGIDKSWFLVTWQYFTQNR